MGHIVKRVGLLLLIISTFSPFISFVFRSYLNFSYSYLLNTGMFGIALIILLSNNARLKVPNYVWFFILFTVYTVFSDFFIANKGLSANYIYSHMLLGSCFMLFYVENGYYQKKYVNKLLDYNYIILIVAIVVILIQQAVSNTFFVYDVYVRDYFYGDDMTARLPSIYSYTGGSVQLGFTFIPVLAVFLGEALQREKFTSIIYFLIIGAIYSVLTKYRWIMLNFSMLVAMVIANKNFRLKKGVFFVIAGVFLLVFGYQLAIVFNIPVEEYINDRILEKSDGGLSRGSANTRLIAIEVFKNLFPQNPIFGKGMFHGFTEGSGDITLMRALGGRSSQIHVGYLSLFYYYGIVGGSIYLAFLISFCRKLYKDSKIHQNWGVFVGALGFIVANFTLVNFHLMYSGIIFLLIYNRYKLDNHFNETETN